MRSFGPYILHEELGSGASGTVFRARQQAAPRDLAIKLLQERPDPDSETELRFLREMGLVATLDHPNLVKIHANGTIEGIRYIAMELVRGLSLQELVAVTGPLEPALALAICSQIAQALAFLHARRVLHRDIKPANVLLAHHGQVKVADFGLMRAQGSTMLTQPGALVGTLPYMAPEVLARGEYSVRSDIWALGVTLYKMLTDRLPVDSTNLVDWLDALDGRQIPTPRSLRAQIPQPVSDLVMQMLEPATSLRDIDADSVNAALVQVLQEQGAPAAAVLSSPATRALLERSAGLTSGSLIRPGARATARHRTAAGATLALALIGLGYVLKPAPAPRPGAPTRATAEPPAPVSAGRLDVFVRQARELDTAVKPWLKGRMYPPMDGKKLRDSTRPLLPEALRVAHFWKATLANSATVARALGQVLDACWATGLLDREEGLAYELGIWSRNNEKELVTALLELNPPGGDSQLAKHRLQAVGGIENLLVQPRDGSKLDAWLLCQTSMLQTLFLTGQYQLACRAASRIHRSQLPATLSATTLEALFRDLAYTVYMNHFCEAVLRLEGDIFTAVYRARGHLDPMNDNQAGWKSMWWGPEDHPEARTTGREVLSVSEWVPWLRRRAEVITQDLLENAVGLLHGPQDERYTELVIVVTKLCRIRDDLRLDSTPLMNAFREWQHRIKSCWSAAALEATSCAVQQGCQEWRQLAPKALQLVEAWAKTQPRSASRDRTRLSVALLPATCYLMQGSVAETRAALKRVRDSYRRRVELGRGLSEDDFKQVVESVTNLVPPAEAAR
jgi:hypothetical protein